MKKLNVRIGVYAALLLSCLGLVTACNEEIGMPGTITTSPVQPSGPKPDYAPTIDPQMQAVIEQFVSYGTPPLPTLSPRQARMAPSVTDAVVGLLVKYGIKPSPQNLTISQRVIPNAAPDGTLIRIYTPTNATGPLPVIVYYHGGGWVIGSLDVYDPSCRALAGRSQAIVVSVDYRLSPENKFPAAHEDAYSAYAWVKANAATIGGNPAKVAVAGESAGGNMAAAVCLLAKQRGLALPIHQLLVYPVANNDLNTASYNQYANAVPLNRPGIQYFVANYFNSPADGDNQLISLVDVADLSGLPPATIVGAEIDPLQTEGMELAD
ncbi:MAG: alpha/beta hydrolase [Bacteroidetes bacterium]|nr:alpha/beta hydrolase [Fibrella sp.]